MKKLHLSYLPAIFLRVVEKRSFVFRPVVFLRTRTHHSCNKCVTETPHIQMLLAPFHHFYAPNYLVEVKGESGNVPVARCSLQDIHR